MTNNSPKSKIIAILLCVFLGGLGIHRFYLGYTVIGVIQLLTIGGCGIWALVDLVLIAIGSLNDKDGQPLV
jgi:TM2 domain-containing membrane protein YozV